MKREAHHFKEARFREMPLKDMLAKINTLVEGASKKLTAKRATREDRRMEKKLGMMRMALLDRMHKGLKESIDVDFLVEMIEFMARAEELIDQYEHDVSAWEEFLELLEKKLEKEGLVTNDAELNAQMDRLKKAVGRLREKIGETPFKPLK